MRSRNSPVHVQRVQRHMATDFSLVIATLPTRIMAAEEVLAESHRRIAQLESELSEFLSDSPVARLNRASVNERIVLPPSALELFLRSQELRELTQGAFDPAVKSEVGESAGRHFDWDEEAGTVWKLHPGARLSFAAIGKGYALDQIRENLEREGFHDYCLVAGGSSILLSGLAAPDTAWNWAWSWEKNPDGTPRGIPFLHASAVPIALGVSGTHEKGSHLLEPRTGRPVARLKSSLIGHPKATEADALSTALFVAGWDESVASFGKMVDKPAMAVIESDGVPRWNGLFQKLWGAPQTSILSLWISALVFVLPSLVRADDGVDLSQMGMEDFTPYLFDRNSLWILLPALSLVLLISHLKQKPRPRNNTGGGK